MANKNKVKFNLKNVHYAKLTETDGVVTYGAPVGIPGAVSLSLSAEGDTTPFFADGIKYYVSVSNNGYFGDLEIALIPDSFRTDILGDTVDNTAKVVIENALTEPGRFALLFEFDGDQNSIRHVFWNCTATRPSVDGSTTTKSKEVSTEKLTIDAAPLADGRVKAKTGSETTEGVYNGWYSEVWEPTVAGG